MTQQLSTNTFGVAKWVVSADATQGTHTTIAAALTSASSGDTIFIRNGTYTENITLKAGVNLAALTCDQQTPNVTILGTATCTFSGTVTCTGIQFKTNSAPAITSSGSNAAILYLYNCYVNANNNTAITSTNAIFQLSCLYCDLNAASTFAVWVITTIGGFALNNCIIGSGDNTTNSIAANAINIYNSNIGTAMSTSNAAGINIFNCVLNNGTNVTFLTTAGTGAGLIVNSIIESGTSSAVSIGTGTTVTLSNCTISSSNTNAITGAGTVYFSNITYIGSSSKINTTTQVVQKSAAISMDSTSTTTGLTFDGTNFLKNYVEAGSWTPTITFGGASTGVTYTTHVGEYTRVGNIIFFSYNITLSSKGSSTGIAAIGGLPVAVAGTNAFMEVGYTLSITLAVGVANVAMAPSGSVLNLFTIALTGGASNLSDTQFGNTSQLQGSGFYFTS